MLLFINIRIIDIVDILLVAFIMYQIYYLIRGTVAFSIFIGILSILFLYFFVDLLQMKLLSTILGTLIGGGAIAIIILFQQELRRFLVYLVTRYFPQGRFSLTHLLHRKMHPKNEFELASIQKACLNMSRSRTGALIVLARSSSLELYVETGDIINAQISSRLIESIFMKNGPLHDGAIIIANNRIAAARCILPFTNKTELSPVYGMRHRAGLGISENTDALVIIVSEERGKISIAEHGQLLPAIKEDELLDILATKFAPAPLQTA